MARAITDDVKEEIIELFRSGISVTEIAAETTVSHVTVRKILEDRGFDLPDKKTRKNNAYYSRPDVIERVVNLFNSGMKYKDIITEENLTAKTIRRILQEAGVYKPRQQTIKQDGAREVTPEEFIRVWQTSTSVRQVEQTLGLTRQAVNARLHMYRKNGVPLKKIKRKKTYDWEKLAEFAKKFIQEV